jgi:hypothetical protein
MTCWGANCAPSLRYRTQILDIDSLALDVRGWLAIGSSYGQKTGNE